MKIYFQKFINICKKIYLFLQNFLKRVQKERAIGGLIAFGVLFATIVIFTLFNNPNANSKFNNLISISDFLSSILILFAFLIAFIIYLSNRNLIPRNSLVDRINSMPDWIPFNHFLKEHLIPLIKRNDKIIVLFNSIEDTNYQSVISQIVAYNNHITDKDNKILDFYKDRVEFYFIDKDSNSEKKESTQALVSLFKSLDIDYYNYIIIATVSSIFTRAIKAREIWQNELNSDIKKHLKKRKESFIKVIGTLSSISQDIKEEVDKDNDLIRVFPPDYDEAKTAMNLLIKACYASKVDSANIIVLHSRTYGEAVAKQSEKIFNSEIASYKLTIHNIDTPKIEFISAKYEKDKNGNYTFNISGAQKSLKDILPKLAGSKNYFYLVGYEPSISDMLRRLNSIINKECKHTILICGTATLEYWKKSICNTLSVCDNLKDDKAYYLKLIESEILDKDKYSLDMPLFIKLKKIKYNSNGSKIELEELNYNNIKEDILNRHKRVTKTNNSNKDSINSLINDNSNYINIYTKIGLDIAKHSIENEEQLLYSKREVLKDFNSFKKIGIEILVNGDSINRYTPKKLSSKN